MRNRLGIATALAISFCGVSSGLARAELAFAVTNISNNWGLVSFHTSDPMNVTTVGPISGLGANERVVGLDFRISNQQLYILTESSRLYTIDRHTAAVTEVGSGPFTPGLTGTSFGFDFNPRLDAIRVVSDDNSNFVLNADTGMVNVSATDVFYNAGDVNEGADPNVVHHAYDRNRPDGVGTQLYAIDTELNALVLQANNLGTLDTVGDLGVDFSTVGGFDISASGIGYAVSTDPVLGTSMLYDIDLATGRAINGRLIGASGINGFTLTAVPEPSSLALMGIAAGSMALVGLRRRRSARAGESR